jgi:hypothetical protein
MLVIGNPENRRISFFQDALLSLGQDPACVISWLDILQGKSNWQEQLNNARLIRIESPGENFLVEQEILALGGLEFAKKLPLEKGRIYYPGVWYQGFKKLLIQIKEQASRSLWFNHPDDIICMFDKPKVKELNPGQCLAACPAFETYDEFLEYASSHAYPRFFIKLSYSSSASGVIAFEYNRKNAKGQAQTTIELVRKNNQNYFYNSLKIKKYSKADELREIINFLFSQGAFVEPWIPKARHENSVFDLRILAINGKRHHTIARCSHTPITNLHLGNQRCLADELGLPAERWQQVDQLVTQVMQSFPNTLYSGLDILIPQSEARLPLLLEANAFGDLLPNLLHQGYNTYQSELLALYKKYPQCMRQIA